VVAAPALEDFRIVVAVTGTILKDGAAVVAGTALQDR
jgi:hypothetical protein